MTRKVLSLLALAALLACGACKKDSDGGSSSSGNTAPAAGEVVVEFPSTDANVWVNGAAVKLGDLRGDVVLVEAWHRQ
jgi:hypothetical protein